MTLLPKARRSFRESFRKWEMKNSRKVNYSWEKKNLQFLLLINVRSFPYPARHPSPVLFSVMLTLTHPNLHLTVSPAASSLLWLLLHLYSLQPARSSAGRRLRRSILNLKGTWPKAALEKENKAIEKEKPI